MLLTCVKIEYTETYIKIDGIHEIYIKNKKKIKYIKKIKIYKIRK